MSKDPIVEDVRKARRRVFEECDNDLGKLLERLKSKENEHRDRLVSRKDVKDGRSAKREAI